MNDHFISEYLIGTYNTEHIEHYYIIDCNV